MRRKSSLRLKVGEAVLSNVIGDGLSPQLEISALRNSPIYKVNRIRAPLLVFQGRNDPRVPYTEAEQIVKALRDRNAPVEYTLFPDEGHGFVKLPNRIVVYTKTADFLDRYMKPNP